MTLECFFPYQAVTSSVMQIVVQVKVRVDWMSLHEENDDCRFGYIYSVISPSLSPTAFNHCAFFAGSAGKRCIETLCPFLNLVCPQTTQVLASSPACIEMLL